jgi:hypothetical protein
MMAGSSKVSLSSSLTVECTGEKDRGKWAEYWEEAEGEMGATSLTASCRWCAPFT